MNAPKMPLRGDAHEVTLVQENGSTKPVIGRSVPPEQSEEELVRARLKVAAHWGARASPRQQSEGGITEPLDLRTRTVLARELPEEAQRMLNEGRTDTRPVPESGVVDKFERPDH
jgi:hypothetical protein